MASRFSAFMAQNVEKIENRKVVVSDRFKDENGKPIEWEIRAIMEDENQAIQNKCFVNVPVPGKPGVYAREIDQTKYTNAMIAASVVYPDLNDAELQDSWAKEKNDPSIKTPEKLLKVMLTSAEMGTLASAVVNIKKTDEAELIEEAKN